MELKSLPRIVADSFPPPRCCFQMPREESLSGFVVTACFMQLSTPLIIALLSGQKSSQAPPLVSSALILIKCPVCVPSKNHSACTCTDACHNFPVRFDQRLALLGASASSSFLVFISLARASVPTAAANHMIRAAKKFAPHRSRISTLPCSSFRSHNSHGVQLLSSINENSPCSKTMQQSY